MDVDVLAVFVEVIQAQGFAPVARARRVDPSTVSRMMASLETELGVRLFHRTTRKLSPTEAALAYYEQVAPLVEGLQRATRRALDADDVPRGLLRVTAAVTFGETNLVPLLPAFLDACPEVSVELVLTNTVVDLVAERIDVALRVGRLSDSSYVAHRLCPMTYLVCASPEYLRQHGVPTRPDDLRRHRCLRYPAGGDGSRWRFRRSKEVVEVPVDGRVTANSGTALRECAVRGVGVLMLPRWNLVEALRAGVLVPLLTEYEATLDAFDSAAWLVYPSRQQVPRKVRAFADFLRRAFAHGAPAEHPESAPAAIRTRR